MTEVLCPILIPRPLKEGDLETAIEKIVRFVTAEGRGASHIITDTSSDIAWQDIELRKEVYGMIAKAIRKENETPRNPGWLKRKVKFGMGAVSAKMDDVLALAKFAGLIQADYVTIFPTYTLHSRGGVVELAREVRSAAKMPVVLENNPLLSFGLNIHTADFKSLVGEDDVRGLIDCSGSKDRLKHYMQASKGRAKVYSGSENQGIYRNCDGVMAGSLNIFPISWGSLISHRGCIGEYLGLKSDVSILSEFSEVCADNPAGSRMYILYKQGLIDSPRGYSGVEVDEGLRQKLDEMMATKEFKIFFSRNNHKDL